MTSDPLPQLNARVPSCAVTGCISAVEIHDRPSHQNASWSGGTSKPNAQRYRCIVADPPWDHSDGTGVNIERGEITGLPYETMSLDKIRGLPVGQLADGQAHLYLWTTSRYLEASFGIARAWGFECAATLVWCKQPRGWSPGGTYGSNVEFCIFATRNDGGEERKTIGTWLREQRQRAGLNQKQVAKHWPSVTGNLTGCVANWELGLNAPTLEQWERLKEIIGFGNERDEEIRAVNAAKGEKLATAYSPTRWWNWPRAEHSAKPEAFQDVVESVSPGPYLELFARRQRLGWHSWGNQALCHVSMDGCEECVPELPKGEAAASEGRKYNGKLCNSPGENS